MTVYYLDTSVAVRILLHHSPAAAAWFDDVNASSKDLLVSSRLLRTEMSRVLRRTEQPLTRRSHVLDYVGTLAVDHAVLQEAEAIVPHIRTLDADHLASALRSGIEDLVVATHDHSVSDVAVLLGFDVHDPVTDDPRSR